MNLGSNYLMSVNLTTSLIGTPAVEVMCNIHSPNITLNLLCGLDGVIYANTTVHGHVIQSHSWLIWGIKPHYLWQPYYYGQRSNSPQSSWTSFMGMVWWYGMCNNIFTHSFSGIQRKTFLTSLKTILPKYEFRELLRGNLHAAIYQALKEITPQDLSFFQHTGYKLNI